MRRLPLSKGALTAIAMVLVTGIGGYSSLVAPKAREIAQLESQVKAVSAPVAPPAPSTVSIGETERVLWGELETRLRARYVPPYDQLRALGEVTEMARAAGLRLESLELQNPQAQGSQRPFTTPGNLAVNPGTLRLTARHRYAELVELLDRVHRGRTYVAVESLDVRRVDDHLESEIRLVSLRWEK